MKKALKGFAIAFSMYSKIPMPYVSWDDGGMEYALCFFPAVGAVIAAAEYLWGFLSGLLSFGTLFRAAGLVIIPVLITGGIHLDGFADTSDALASWGSAEERRRILKDPHIGAFSAISLACYFTAALGVSSAVRADFYAAVCMIFIMSRALSGLAAVLFRKSGSDGTLAAFSSGARKRLTVSVLIIWYAAASAFAVFMVPLCGVIMSVLGLFLFWLYHHMSYKYFNGTSGDIAGYFVCATELVAPAVLIIITRIFRI